MKKYLIASVAVLAILTVVLSAVGQPERARQGNAQGGRMRQGGGRGGMFMTREARLEAIKKIEDALAKLKAEPEIQRPQGGFQNMSQEERTKLFTQFREARQAQQKSLDAIVAQVAALEGRRAPEREGAKFVIVNTADLKPIQESAVKEKATETTQLLDRLIARASGERGAFGGQRGQRGQGGQRPQRQRQQQQ
jgi:hypothetical protein